MTSFAVLDEFLEPLSRCLDTESARRIASLPISTKVQQRVDHLSELANDGLLYENEHSDYEALINAADFLSILKLKARRLLAENLT
jgi:hypothetical protein